MKNILIIGANSYIAKHLIKKLTEMANIFLVSHKISKDHLYIDDLDTKYLDIIKSIDVIINLAGANIGEKLWTKKRKIELLESRIITTEKIVNLFNKYNPNAHLINFSAIGIYETNIKQDEYNQINYQQYNNFSQEITKKWESIALKYQGDLTILRLGVVLNADSITYKKLMLSHKFRCGIIFGNGNQYLSWIALDDLMVIILYVINNHSIGIINCTAPKPITNYQLNKDLGNKYKSKIYLKMPKFLIKLLFGQMGSELFLNSLEVHPTKLLQKLNYKFKYPDFANFLNSICK